MLTLKPKHERRTNKNMAIYALVFKTKDGDQVFLTREFDGWCCLFSEYSSAAKILVSVTDWLKFLLDGEPNEIGNFLLGYRTVRKTVRTEDKERWARILKTLEIKRVSDIMLVDGTMIKTTEEDMEKKDYVQTGYPNKLD